MGRSLFAALARRAVIRAIVMLVVVLTAVPALASDAQGASKRYLAGKFTQRTVDRFTRDLAQVGIAVYRPGARRPIRRVRRPVSPIRLTAHEARSAALSAHGRLGLSVDSLNRVAGRVRVTPKLSIPAGTIVAAWAKRARTPSARLAQRILGRPRWKKYRAVVLPHAVSMLFASDIAVHLRRPGARRATARGAQRAPAGICSRTLAFVEGTINGAFDSLGHIRTDRAFFNNLFRPGSLAARISIGLGDFLSGKVNMIIDGTRQVVLTGVRVPVKALTEALAGVAAAVSVVESVGNALLPWSGTVTASPNPISKGVGTGERGAFTLKVSAPGSDFRWPRDIDDCARTIGVTLPTVSPKGAQVRWDVSEQDPGGLIVPTGSSGPLDDRGTARLEFETTTETREEALGDPEIGAVIGVAKIHRDDLDRLGDRLTNQLLAALPGIVEKTLGGAIRAKVRPLLAKITQKISTIRDFEVNTVLAVRYHTPQERRRGTEPSCGSRPSGISYQVVPGESIAGIRLGTTRLCVWKLRPLGLAKPTGSARNRELYDTYRTPGALLLVGYRANRVFFVSTSLGPWSSGDLANGDPLEKAADQTGCQGHGHNPDGSRMFDEPGDFTHCEKRYGANNWFTMTFNVGDSDLPPALSGFTLSTQQAP